LVSDSEGRGLVGTFSLLPCKKFIHTIEFRL
jgi:hypothetical protein